MRATASIVAAVLLIAGFAAIAAADPSSPSPSNLTFLKSLGSSQVVLPPEVGTPSPQWKTCSASNNCGDGNTAACTGSSTCQTTIAGVQCDGTEVRCPNFCSISQNCDCCNGPYTSTCWSLRGDCQYTGSGIACNGATFTCFDSCPFCPGG
jgi:hypothetical protein